MSAAEGRSFHNRLTHSMKVAQVSRRLAERLIAQNLILQEKLDPDICEAAALAHDLGHPPFGHVGEKKLNELAVAEGLSDGFEGNAQTFRILTRLGVHKSAYPGLNLTRGTLNATLKYPWPRARKGDEHRKFGYYDDDLSAFTFARAGGPSGKGQSLEAQVMDLSDEITYSVHDLEDFYRAGMIPLDRLVDPKGPVMSAFLGDWKAREPKSSHRPFFDDDKAVEEVCQLLEAGVIDAASPGSKEQLQVLSEFRSIAITRLINAAKFDGTAIAVSKETKHVMAFLKQLIWRFVIRNPRLATQQCGQQKVIERLFRAFYDALRDPKGNVDVVPTRFAASADQVTKEQDASDRKLKSARLAVDIVASLSEAEAVLLDKRLSGVESGSVSDLVM